MQTVLVVEDDPMNWRVFQKILTRRGGFAARHTENVEEVLQIASAKEADIILMDIALTNSYYQGRAVDGIEITQLLKAKPQTASIPVILVTAYAHDSDREKYLAKSGADGFIAKPVIDHQNFVDQIRAKLLVPCQ